MADEDDRPAFGRETAEDGEDLLRLLGREDRGRLVEDDDLRVPVERLEDLDPLLPADRQGADQRVRVDVEPEPLAEFDDTAMRLAAIEEDGIGHRLLAEQDVVGDRQHRHEHEVLVDHADAPADGVGRIVDRDGRAIEEDLAGVGRGQSVQDVHERGLAGPVLAEQGVDLTRPDLEVDRVVRDHARIALGDAAHLQGWRAHGRSHHGLGLLGSG